MLIHPSVRKAGLRIAIAVGASAFLFPSNANALAALCNTTTGDCIYFDGPCNGGGSTIWIVCFTLGPVAFSQATDHILTRNGQVWLVQGKKQSPVASDELQASITRINAPFARRTSDAGVREEAERASKALQRVLFDKPDKGTVSATRLMALKRETGLDIREESQ